jgi:hypothetical protein
MSLSPEGRRRLIRHLGLNPEDQKDFSDSLDRLMDDVSKCAPEHLFIKRSGFGRSYGIGTQFFGRIERINAGDLIGLNCRCTPTLGLPPKHSLARRKQAASWWFARAETRRIIERMMQK